MADKGAHSRSRVSAALGPHHQNIASTSRSILGRLLGAGSNSRGNRPARRNRALSRQHQNREKLSRMVQQIKVEGVVKENFIAKGGVAGGQSRTRQSRGRISWHRKQPAGGVVHRLAKSQSSPRPSVIASSARQASSSSPLTALRHQT